MEGLEEITSGKDVLGQLYGNGAPLLPRKPCTKQRKTCARDRVGKEVEMAGLGQAQECDLDGIERGGCHCSGRRRFAA